MFNDGANGKNIGKGKLEYRGIPYLKYVLLVYGLTVNLIRISQLSDQDLYVNFNRDECIVTGKNHAQLIKGSRSTNNFYMWSPYDMNHP